MRAGLNDLKMDVGSPPRARRYVYKSVAMCVIPWQIVEKVIPVATLLHTLPHFFSIYTVLPYIRLYTLLIM